MLTTQSITSNKHNAHIVCHKYFLTMPAQLHQLTTKALNLEMGHVQLCTTSFAMGMKRTSISAGITVMGGLGAVGRVSLE